MWRSREGDEARDSPIFEQILFCFFSFIFLDHFINPQEDLTPNFFNGIFVLFRFFLRYVLP